MARFYPLTVTDIRKETREAVVVTLAPAEADRAAFDFIQGQYLTFRGVFDGEELRRCYSICAGRDEGVLRVGIRRVEGGTFSTWANQSLAVGDVLEAMPPAGKFHTAIEPERAKHYLGFAGGSGITPVLSIVKTVLAREPLARFTLVYANRRIGSIMFREELEDLKNLHLGRLSVLHVLESEGQEIELLSGRIDAAKMALLFRHWVDPASVDTAVICGPEPMMLTIASALRAHGIGEERIRFELFASAQPGRARPRAANTGASAPGAGTEAIVTLDGTTRNFRWDGAGQSLLEAALAADLDVPYSCKAGVCSTCRAKLLEGEVEMAVNHALEDYEVRAGYVLTCQCHPLSDRVVVTYDQ